MKSFTIHKLDDETGERLEKLARRERASINQTAKKLRRAALGVEGASAAERRRDFEEFFGDWTEDEAAEFDEAVRVFEAIDEDSWR